MVHIRKAKNPEISALIGCGYFRRAMQNLDVSNRAIDRMINILVQVVD